MAKGVCVICGENKTVGFMKWIEDDEIALLCQDCYPHEDKIEVAQMKQELAKLKARVKD